jgi:hypothetical protein
MMTDTVSYQANAKEQRGGSLYKVHRTRTHDDGYNTLLPYHMIPGVPTAAFACAHAVHQVLLSTPCLLHTREQPTCMLSCGCKAATTRCACSMPRGLHDTPSVLPRQPFGTTGTGSAVKERGSQQALPSVLTSIYPLPCISRQSEISICVPRQSAPQTRAPSPSHLSMAFRLGLWLSSRRRTCILRHAHAVIQVLSIIVMLPQGTANYALQGALEGATPPSATRKPQWSLAHSWRLLSFPCVHVRNLNAHAALVCRAALHLPPHLVQHPGGHHASCAAHTRDT